MKIIEAAEVTGLSQKTIRRHVHAGTLKASKKGNSYFIEKDELLRWADDYEKNNKKIKSSEIIKDIKNITSYEPTFINIKNEMKKDYWNQPKQNGPKFADFFSGAGGMSVGFVKAGFTPIYSIEVMKEAVMTYNSNISKKFDHELVETRDITNPNVRKEAIEFLKNNKPDVILGGFPCQGFSMAGSRVVDDPRNSLYIPMLEIVKAVQPKVVVMENVLGLRSMLDGKVEKKIVSDYIEAGYKINVATLNSADYGVPQQRKRVILIANKIDAENLHPKPFLSKKEYVSVKEAIGDLLDSPEDIDFNHMFTKHSKDMSDKIGLVEEGKSLYKGYSDAWKKVFWDKPSPTVKENHGGVFLHPKRNSVMTARELARLQSFPDDFIFKGSKKWQLVQIGNAVPPIMGKAIANSVKKMLKNNG